jgi:hypothetical protein
MLWRRTFTLGAAMSTKRIIIILMIIGPIVVFLAAYIGAVRDGSVPPPNWDEIARHIDLGTTTAAATVLVLALAVIGLLAMLAPIIYAARANDPLTVFVSLAMTGTAIALMVASRTAVDQISALIIFLANITLSAVVYAAHKIAAR